MADSHSTNELCAYERERARQIELNCAKLVELGIATAQNHLRICGKQQKVRGTPLKAGERVMEEPRRSERTTRDTARNQKHDKEDISWGSWAFLSGSRLRASGQSRRDYWAVGWVNTLWPPSEAVQEALAKAELAAAQCAGATGIKVMLPSHVAGGFWLQLPMEFTSSLPQVMGKHAMVLRDTEGKDSPVVWLRRGGSGGGLSGGWRGFAIAHSLAVGDVVLFEKSDSRTLRASIFRAVSNADRQAMVEAAPPDDAAQVSPSLGAKVKVQDGETKAFPAAQPSSQGDVPQDVEVAVSLESDRDTGSESLEPEKVTLEALDDDVYEVEKVLAHRIGDSGCVEYLTVWVGYDEHTWEPRESFLLGRTVTGLLLRYEKEHNIRPAKRRRV
eukprot:GGOE01028090.1.p1 GENE.GGOE01028090.1~~GGOE01028090.1.p1  ORF type:complete len:387 (-),score=45.74 GGOE01028090.1:371-1531(-)